MNAFKPRSDHLVLGLSLLLTVLASPAGAGDGVLEINQACAESDGCFPGDSGGFPVTISNSGSYLLTGNLDLTSESPHTHAIQVSAGHVTIDLGGFQIEGPCAGGPPCTPTGSGAGVYALFVRSVTVRNGTVRGMGDRGVVVGGGSRVEGVHAVGNGGFGISAGDSCRLDWNHVEDNANYGIRAGVGSILVHNTSENNVGGGFELTGDNMVVTDNSAVGNGGTGFNSQGAVSMILTGNTAKSNAGHGIRTIGGDLVRYNHCYNNGDGAGEFGIVAASGTLLIGNVVQVNQNGVSVSAGTSMSKNVVVGSVVDNLVGSPLYLDCNAIGGSPVCPP